MKLTKRLIDAATYQGEGNARFVLWDSEVPGFGLRIFPSGKKAFLLSYRVQGRKRLMTIGAYGILTLDQARIQARALLAKVETENADPLATRQREAQGQTIRDLCTSYMERHGDHKKSHRDDRRRLDQHVLPAWGSLKVSAITQADVAALHAKIGKTRPYEANRTLALLSKMFELARRWDFVPRDHSNPARDIDHFKEHKRDRWITPEELPRLAQAINEEPNEVARCALWLYLLTGARKSELLQARWEHVDWNRAELKLPDTKAGRVHYIPLSSPALALLREIPREDGNPFILPGRGPRSKKDAGERPPQPAHLVNISKPWNRVREAAGVVDVRLHDLRRTVGSWLAQSGNSLHLIGRVLNHSNQSTTAVYARFGEDSVRVALEQHGARILDVAGVTPTANAGTSASDHPPIDP